MRRSAALLGFAALLLTACAADPQPRFADPTATPSTSEAPMSPPAEPPAATAPEASPPRDPLAAVAAFVTGRNTALATGDTAALEALSTSTCEPCRTTIDTVTETYGAGGSWQTNGWTITNSRVARQTEDRAVVNAAIDMSDGVVTEDASAAPEEFAADARIFRFELDINADGRARVAMFGPIA